MIRVESEIFYQFTFFRNFSSARKDLSNDTFFIFYRKPNTNKPVNGTAVTNRNNAAPTSRTNINGNVDNYRYFEFAICLYLNHSQY